MPPRPVGLVTTGAPSASARATSSALAPALTTPAARPDQRPLRLAQDPSSLRETVGVRLYARPALDVRNVDLCAAVLEVDRDLDGAWLRPSGLNVARRSHDRLRDVLGAAHALDAARNAAQHRRLVVGLVEEALPLAVVLRVDLPRDKQHRRRRRRGLEHPGHRVRRAGPGARDRDPEAARGTRVPIGAVHGSLLVADADHLDPAAGGDRVVDRQVVHAHDPEDVTDIEGAQRLVHRLAAASLDHHAPPLLVAAQPSASTSVVTAPASRPTVKAMATRPANTVPEWMRELALEVWRAEELPLAQLPRLRVAKAKRSTRGYFSASSGATRIVVRRQRELRRMRNTLLHELAHAIHRLHCVEPPTCRCERRCTADSHGAVFKRHLARLEHRHQPGAHSRWGLAGCLGRARVPPRTPWHVDIPCPREGPGRVR